MDTPNKLNMEEVAEQLDHWRQTKHSRWDRIPDHLRLMIKQLVPRYSRASITYNLKLSSLLLAKIKKTVYHGIDDPLALNTNNANTSFAFRPGNAWNVHEIS